MSSIIWVRYSLLTNALLTPIVKGPDLVLLPPDGEMLEHPASAIAAVAATTTVRDLILMKFLLEFIVKSCPAPILGS
jgi:hypothetical protein